MTAAILIAALMLEGVLGYPARLYRRIGHPVSWIGAVIAAADRRWNRPEYPAAVRRSAGLGLMIGLIGMALAAGLLLARLFPADGVGALGQVVLVAVWLAPRSLHDHVAAVANGLRRDGIAGGRAAVARIVGRATATLDDAGVSRAAIESLAENFSDGVVAPALAYLLFGLPGVIAYKAINTADSMIGHKEPRYAAFGWAAARSDDIANLLPARLTALMIAVAAGRRAGAALRSAWRDARTHRSPNAGWPEAAMAGALDLRLGGPRHYGDQAVAGAWLGCGRTTAGPAEIDRALRLYRIALVILVLGVGISGAL